ncbi:hypothetical protein BBJ28_00021386, partial [Nothophytophthora sp. Chile5]
HGDRTPVLTEIGTKVRMSSEEKDFWASKVATPEQLAQLELAGKAVGRDPSLPPVINPSRGARYPCGLLTKKGVEHMTGKGRALRERYGDLVVDADGKVEADQVYVLSSSVPRTIESVQCLLRGMFHEEAQEAEAATEAPTFHIRTYNHNVLAPMHPLQVFNEIELIVSDDVVALRNQNEREAMDKLSLHLRECLGISADVPMPWTAVKDALTCRKAHDWPFPEGVDDKVFEEVTAYDAWLWHRLYQRKEFCYRVFKDGVQEVYGHLKAVVEDKHQPMPKLSFFSAHDNSIVALVSALQLQVGPKLPEYGTIVAFEVYEDVASHEFFLKVLFEGEAVPFAGHQHDPLCPFSHFESLALEFLAIKA